MEDVFALLTAVAVAFGPLAVAVTKLVDMLRNLLDRTPESPWPKWVWNLAAFVIAGLVCVLFQLDVASALVAQVPRLSGLSLTGTAGQLLTALGVGGFASYWHEHLDALSAKAKGKASG